MVLVLLSKAFTPNSEKEIGESKKIVVGRNRSEYIEGMREKKIYLYV